MNKNTLARAKELTFIYRRTDYDQDTQRSELFERNLVKDGFTIKNGEEICD